MDNKMKIYGKEEAAEYFLRGALHIVPGHVLTLTQDAYDMAASIASEVKKADIKNRRIVFPTFGEIKIIVPRIFDVLERALNAKGITTHKVQFIYNKDGTDMTPLFATDIVVGGTAMKYLGRIIGMVANDSDRCALINAYYRMCCLDLPVLKDQKVWSKKLIAEVEEVIDRNAMVTKFYTAVIAEYIEYLSLYMAFFGENMQIRDDFLNTSQIIVDESMCVIKRFEADLYQKCDKGKVDKQAYQMSVMEDASEARKYEAVMRYRLFHKCEGPLVVDTIVAHTPYGQVCSSLEAPENIDIAYKEVGNHIETNLVPKLINTHKRVDEGVAISIPFAEKCVLEVLSNVLGDMSNVTFILPPEIVATLIAEFGRDVMSADMDTKGQVQHFMTHVGVKYRLFQLKDKPKVVYGISVSGKNQNKLIEISLGNVEYMYEESLPV